MSAEQLTPSIRAAIAQQCHAVFADPNATTAQVLKAAIDWMVINDMNFHTASGDMTVHLTNAVAGLQDLETTKGKRRFLGMAREDSNGPDT